MKIGKREKARKIDIFYSPLRSKILITIEEYKNSTLSLFQKNQIIDNPRK